MHAFQTETMLYIFFNKYSCSHKTIRLYLTALSIYAHSVNCSFVLHKHYLLCTTTHLVLSSELNWANGSLLFCKAQHDKIHTRMLNWCILVIRYSIYHKWFVEFYKLHKIFCKLTCTIAENICFSVFLI